MLPTFKNEPLTDFSDSANVAAFEAALRRVRDSLDRLQPMLIGGREVLTSDVLASFNPAAPHEVVARFPQGTVQHVDQAVEAAQCAFKAWSHTPAFERAGYLLRAAAMMRRERHTFSAAMVIEAGKPWVEADADTAEAIDFMEYYAHQIVALEDASDRLVPQAGERGQLRYIALGVGAIISPWNFPVAIFSGMMSAALVSGNTVVVKPSELTPYVAWMVVDLFRRCSIPSGVINFLTGPGAIVGGRMVEHPGTRFVAFTGSRQVGTEIYAKAAVVHPGQRWLKRSILEMGGKDAIVVDTSADLDEAAAGIVDSAFGFSGQKCSACSRVIALADVYDAVLERVVERTRKLRVGMPEAGLETDLGPVIDTRALDKVKYYVDVGRSEAELVCGGSAVETPDHGYFVEPTVFSGANPHARISQEEIFGPVVSFIRASTFDEALAFANDTDYGLTGAVYAMDHGRLEQARREFHVGNLYFNRKCTGAMVGVHPFGGFGMSGTDSKAGGPDYLLHYTQPQSITEKL
ncbi:MAG: L-glutamate gamma-semialdehyde dehydrogenase [Chloroflexi bacterium]|nr:L-glutamate gamma-semialdehyde dehydrogenase [Chloroflexota bacterium]